MSPKEYREAKAEGGERYEAVKAEWRKRIAARRKKLGRRPYDKTTRAQKKRQLKNNVRYRQGRLLQHAKRRARNTGMEATVKWADIAWVEVCPVLGLKLTYFADKPNTSNSASLDRWDNKRGYVPGNVFVISLRANQIKGDASAAELVAAARYAEFGVW
jgi:hypothetical protein